MFQNCENTVSNSNIRRNDVTCSKLTIETLEH